MCISMYVLYSVGYPVKYPIIPDEIMATLILIVKFLSSCIIPSPGLAEPQITTQPTVNKK